MLRLGTDLSRAFSRRTLRVLYGQTQAYPYGAQLDAVLDRTAEAFTGAGSAVLPGLVAVKTTGENVTRSGASAVSAGKTPTRAFGLFADYVGGTLGSNFPTDWTQIGVWRGVGSVYELLAPVFATTNLSTLAAGEDGTGAKEVYLNSNANGQLLAETAGTFVATNTARLVSNLSANAIIVELLV